jgi:hypothetical protein
MEAKIGIVLTGLAAVGANLPDVGDGMDAGLIRSLVGLGATGVLGMLMWRQIDVIGKALGRNTDAVDRMREHCSAKNGEAPAPREARE